MVRRTKEEALETRNSLITAALEQFCEKGIARTTLSDISAAAGVTRGAFYWHFKNKAQLFEALWAQLRNPLEELAELSENPQEPRPMEKLHELIVLLLQTVVSSPVHQHIFRLLINRNDLEGELQEIGEHMQLMHAQFRARTQRMLTNAVNQGQLPVGLPVGLASYMLHSMIDGLIANWMAGDKQVDMHVEAPIMADAMLVMLRQGFVSAD
ncbi:TetR family transcriptional regulator [Marinobacterium rhizophilum]|uniref:TetR family transcriptional regulator n=1 Tax=Marinobacterium rhizophilum TaxID=420402 RepID=A0ABY5HDY4_9GAMM|nr:TetR family transcriptional regulator [Marinobacterium rhizophilum]UTW10314.1 TetR family transcriptional regulator [Marinobacterium rhizophilum]